MTAGEALRDAIHGEVDEWLTPDRVERILDALSEKGFMIVPDDFAHTVLESSTPR